MTDAALRKTIEALWDRRDTVSASTGGQDREAVEQALAALETGGLRVAEPGPDGWHVNQWLKKAVLLSFRLQDSVPMQAPEGRRCSTKCR